MNWTALAEYLMVSAAGVVAGYFIVRFAWYVHSQWKIRRAGPRRLLATRHRLWHHPEPESSADLRFGPGGREGVPAPPYQFVEEHVAGSQPCIAVRDAQGRLWRVKWGHEVKPETFAVRLAWACGYFAEVTHYVAEGRIEGATGLGRAHDCLDDEGRFHDARFELEDRSVRMLFDEHSWSWHDNPFVGTKQLSGLKIVIMLLSNWDTKDRRDVSRGSNTAIFEHRVGRWPRTHHEARYLLTDWGGAMGKWGSNIVTRGRWDVDGFEAQTPQFVTGVDGGRVQFGYTGQRTEDIAGNIPVAHARWFHGIAHGFTEHQLADGFLASGATDEEAQRFARALMRRLAQLEIKYPA